MADFLVTKAERKCCHESSVVQTASIGLTPLSAEVFVRAADALVLMAYAERKSAIAAASISGAAYIASCPWPGNM
jgi:hypothetical protein